MKPRPKIKWLCPNRKAVDTKTDDELIKSGKLMVRILDKWITEHYGKRCEEASPGCANCQIWALRDALAMFILWA